MCQDSYWIFSLCSHEINFNGYRKCAYLKIFSLGDMSQAYPAENDCRIMSCLLWCQIMAQGLWEVVP